MTSIGSLLKAETTIAPASASTFAPNTAVLITQSIRTFWKSLLAIRDVEALRCARFVSASRKLASDGGHKNAEF